MPTKRLDRRTFLRGATACLALPALDAMAGPAVAGEAPRRLAFFYVPNGVNIMKWVPAGGTGPLKLSPSLEPLAELRSEVSVLTGLGHPNAKGGHSGADTWLTGADLTGTAGYDYRNTVSADQVAAAAVGGQTRLPSLELSSRGGSGSPGHSHTLSFNREGVPQATEHSPRAVFERLFAADPGATRRAKRRRFLEGRSILDEVMGQAKSLNHKLGVDDRRKMEQYLNSVREVERRVGRAERWMDVPKPEVDAKSLKLDAEPGRRGDRRSYVRVMFDLIHLAFKTDSTRVVTFQLGREAAGGHFSELGLSANHHELSHHGGDAKMLSGLHKIDRFYIGELAYFLKRLRDTPEGGDSLLGRTAVMYGSGMNSGTGGGHSPKNLPLLVAGGRGLGLKPGRHLAHEEGSTPLANVLLTLLRAAGVKTTEFQDSTGELGGLV